MADITQSLSVRQENMDERDGYYPAERDEQRDMEKERMVGILRQSLEITTGVDTSSKRRKRAAPGSNGRSSDIQYHGEV